MIKRLLALFTAILFVCSNLWANEEYSIILDRGDAIVKTVELPYGNIYLRLTEYGNYHKLFVSLENTTNSTAILLFGNTYGEKVLKRNKAKIEFEKTYPGSKGHRSVFGCSELNHPFISITPEEKTDLFVIDINSASSAKFGIPVYLAKYDAKKLVKKGAYNINYKILSEDLLNFNIEIRGWSENDKDFVSLKSAVDEYVSSVNAVAFCKNKKHVPNLSLQIKPYQEKKDSLLNAIDKMLQNPAWMSTDKPYIKYSELLDQLNKVDLNEHTYDCGEHKVAPKQHSCSYCKLSAQQIYHQLDDLYQKMRAGRLSKNAAVATAQKLNSCYQKNSRRKKDSGYSDKISRFYSRIINY